jgi:hypothetical protein
LISDAGDDDELVKLVLVFVSLARRLSMRNELFTGCNLTGSVVAVDVDGKSFALVLLVGVDLSSCAFFINLNRFRRRK